MITLETNVIRNHDLPEISDERVSQVVFSVLEAEQEAGEWTIAVVLVDDREIQRMHRDFMDIDEPTDIMTFPADPDADGYRGGDLVISVETAGANALDQGHSKAHEVEFLIAHGVLHLLGWTDGTSEDRAAMLDRQRAILSGMDQAGSGI
jgi:probable rRNA maturation factor